MKEIRKDEEAVSPVIGVILMVVITVIIAAIIAVFAFGVGGPAKAPEAQLRFTAVYNGSGLNDSISVSHAGGDALILKNEQITITDAVSNNQIIGPSLMSVTWTTSTGTIAPGQTLANYSASAHYFTGTGQILRVQVFDVPTGQLITDTKATVQ